MKRILFLFILLSVSITTFSQKVSGGEAKVIKIEKSKASSDKLDEASIRCYYKFSQPITTNNQTIQQVDTMTLDIGAKASHYYDPARAMRDSIFGDFMSNKLNPSTIQSLSVLKDAAASFDTSAGTTIESGTKGETVHLYKKRLSNEIIIIEKAENSQNKYRCIDNVIPKWDITADTLTVLGYLCQKANTFFRGRTYEAWFTPDIPVNDGPWKLYGLPGLILKANDMENLFSFEIIGLEHLNPVIDIRLSKEDYIKASRKDLEKLKNKRSGGMAVNVNGGNVVIVQKKNENKYLSLETE